MFVAHPSCTVRTVQFENFYLGLLCSKFLKLEGHPMKDHQVALETLHDNVMFC